MGSGSNGNTVTVICSCGKETDEMVVASQLKHICPICKTNITIMYEVDEATPDEIVSRFSEKVLGILVCPVCELGGKVA